MVNVDKEQKPSRTALKLSTYTIIQRTVNILNFSVPPIAEIFHPCKETSSLL